MTRDCPPCAACHLLSKSNVVWELLLLACCRHGAFIVGISKTARHWILLGLLDLETKFD